MLGFVSFYFFYRKFAVINVPQIPQSLISSIFYSVFFMIDYHMSILLARSRQNRHTYALFKGTLSRGLLFLGQRSSKIIT